MIRAFTNNDDDIVLSIWLAASIKAHDFIDPSFWESHVDAMRNTYLPASDVFVYQWESAVVGFYALIQDTLAALFVAPDFQGRGIGKRLLAHAKTQRTALSLSVYQENTASYMFYLSQGFSVVDQGIDEHTGHPEYKMRAGRSEVDNASLHGVAQTEPET